MNAAADLRVEDNKRVGMALMMKMYSFNEP
jgi:hypothetical protein